MHRNALLSDAPTRFHQDSVSPRTREAQRQTYVGVNTTPSLEIAAAYAMSTWQQLGGAASDDSGYPVILALDTSGFVPTVDADALVIGTDLLDGVRGQVETAIAEGLDLYELAEMGDDGDIESDVGVGSDPGAAVFDAISTASPLRALAEGLVEWTGGDEFRAREHLETFVAEGAASLPVPVVNAVVQQNRYEADFEIDRLSRVIAFRPWWREVFDVYWDFDDSDEQERAELIESAGWRLWTIEDIYSIGPEPSRAIYESGRTPERLEYHGTTSTIVQKAFPDLTLPPAPFPVQGLDL